MHDAMKRLEIQHLRAAGLGVERTALHAGVSPRTVERVSAEEPIADVVEAEARRRAAMGRPSKVEPDGVPESRRIVRTDGYVDHLERRYFAGFEHVAKTLTARVSEHSVALWSASVHVATHPRYPLNGRYSILPEQRAQVLEKSGARPFVKRQLLADLCPAATWYMTELRHKRPETWREDV
jgi:hypothetical protein